MKQNRAAMALLLAALSARADHIEFKSGGRIEGVIVAETPADVTIKTGPGKATFKKSQIRSIFRDPAANDAIQQKWRDENFASPEFLPPALRPLAVRFGELTAKEAAAIRAQRESQSLRDEAARASAEMEKLKARNTAVAAQLQRAKNDSANVAAYNQLVTENNDIVSRYTLLQSRHEQIEKLSATNRAAVTGYLSALSSFRSDFEAARAKAAGDAPSQTFFNKAGARIAAMSAALEEVRIPADSQARGHAVVTARINGRYDARLVVDTGASVVALSSAAATRFRIAPDPARKGTATLADGKEIAVNPITLGSIAVAGVRLDHVDAVIISDAPASDLDGLLGMSFLREFDVQIDSANNQVVLRRLPSAR